MTEILLYLALVIITVVIAGQLARRLGYEGAAGLLMLFPLVNYVVVVFWAFAESPNERLLRDLRRRIAELEAATGQSPVAFLEALNQEP